MAREASGNLLCLSLLPNDFGKLYLWDSSVEPLPHEEAVLYPLNLGFSKFVESLQPDLIVELAPDVVEEQIKMGSSEEIEAFISKGTNIFAKNNIGQTLACIAAKHTRIDTVKLLLARNAPTEGAIELAIRRVSEEIVTILLRHGVNLKEKSSDKGMTPLHVAVSEYFDSPSDRIVLMRIIKLLIAHGADANAKNQFDVSPIERARMGKASELIRVLSHQ